MTENPNGDVIDEGSPIEELERLQSRFVQAEDNFVFEFKLILLACYRQFVRLHTDRVEWDRLVQVAKACGAVNNNVSFGDPDKMMRLIVRFVAHRATKSRSQLFKYAAALTAVFIEHPREEQVEKRIASLLIETTYKRTVSRSKMQTAAPASDAKGSSREVVPANVIEAASGAALERTNASRRVQYSQLNPPPHFCAPGKAWLFVEADKPAIDRLLNMAGTRHVAIEIYQADDENWKRVTLEHLLPSLTEDQPK